MSRISQFLPPKESFPVGSLRFHYGSPFRDQFVRDGMVTVCLYAKREVHEVGPDSSQGIDAL